MKVDSIRRRQPVPAPLDARRHRARWMTVSAPERAAETLDGFIPRDEGRIGPFLRSCRSHVDTLAAPSCSAQDRRDPAGAHLG